ncbi:MAG: TIGR00730 family Rossman fold protein [Pirellulales bacterium]
MIDPENDARIQRILQSPSYKLAEDDVALIKSNEMRPLRVQLELQKPELALAANNIRSTIVVFGGTQIVPQEAAERRLEAAQAALAAKPDDALRARAVSRAQRLLEKSHFYNAARRFAHCVSLASQRAEAREYVIVTGGGPGIMEAANRGAFDAQGKSIGLNITLPHEQVPNPYITPDLCFQFRYFALRKMHFLLRAKALVVFPGGFGTLDELFDALTLRQTGKLQKIPIILFGRAYWERVINLSFLADEGVIADDDLKLLSYAETPEEAWKIIVDFHAHLSPADICRPQ